jgi:hypothetical protein
MLQHGRASCIVCRVLRVTSLRAPPSHRLLATDASSRPSLTIPQSVSLVCALACLGDWDCHLKVGAARSCVG